MSWRLSSRFAVESWRAPGSTLYSCAGQSVLGEGILMTVLNSSCVREFRERLETANKDMPYTWSETTLWPTSRGVAMPRRMGRFGQGHHSHGNLILVNSGGFWEGAAVETQDGGPSGHGAPTKPPPRVHTRRWRSSLTDRTLLEDTTGHIESDRQIVEPCTQSRLSRQSLG